MCTTVVVGRNRSATGSVLIAHSEELGRNSAHRVEVCPRRTPAAGETYPLFSGGSLEQPAALPRYVATRIFDKRHYPGDHTGGVNEHGVAVANNMALMRGVPEARAYDVVPGGVIWTEFLQLVLERARTAREGAALVGELCGRHGLSCDSGTMVAVADPEDAWWVELARDGQWVAKRVGPDEVVDAGQLLSHPARGPRRPRQLHGLAHPRGPRPRAGLVPGRRLRLRRRVRRPRQPGGRLQPGPSPRLRGAAVSSSRPSASPT